MAKTVLTPEQKEEAKQKRLENLAKGREKKKAEREAAAKNGDLGQNNAQNESQIDKKGKSATAAAQFNRRRK